MFFTLLDYFNAVVGAAPKEKFRTKKEIDELRRRREAAYDRLQQRQASDNLHRRVGRSDKKLSSNPWRESKR